MYFAFVEFRGNALIVYCCRNGHLERRMIFLCVTYEKDATTFLTHLVFPESAVAKLLSCQTLLTIKIMGNGKGSSSNVKFPWTCPPDPRYHNANATKWCFAMFVDYQKCTRLLGKGYEPCNYFRRCYKSLCPNSWVKKWETQINEGVFPVDLPDPKKK